MIEAISLIMFCIPVILNGNVVDYDCSWNYYFVEYEGMIHELYYMFDKTGKELPENVSIRGLTIYSLKSVYILKGHAADYTMLGCNIFQHELRHAWGQSHEEMPLSDIFCPRK